MTKVCDESYKIKGLSYESDIRLVRTYLCSTKITEKKF